MLKYAPLTDELVACGSETIRYEFRQLDDLVGGLPPSARRHRAWWSNEIGSGGHVQSRAWMTAGFVVENVDLAVGVVEFRRVAPERGPLVFAFYVRQSSPNSPPEGVLHISRELVEQLAAGVRGDVRSQEELPLLEVEVPIRAGDEWVHEHWDTRFHVMVLDGDESHAERDA